MNNSSNMPGFYELTHDERLTQLAKTARLNQDDLSNLNNFNSLSSSLADAFIENAIGTFSLPLGVATNFRVNEQEVLVPMAVEESSVVAAASYGAKLVRSGGGFYAKASEPIMTGQIQIKVMGEFDSKNFEFFIQEKKQSFLDFANALHPRLKERGGGAQDITWYFIEAINSLVLELHIHTCDAMGANIVNSMCEKLSVHILKFLPKHQLGLRILSNLTLGRMVKASCVISHSVLKSHFYSGIEVVDRIVSAWEFAWHDTFRACTHNKGVMNGIDPVLIATGNDWRAVEAGVHAYAAYHGRYRPITTWKKNSLSDLEGSIEIPLAIGTVGGVTRLHPTAQTALKMMHYPNAKQLSEIIVSVGLAQNLSALKALATDGIQAGHMQLHQKNIALMKN